MFGNQTLLCQVVLPVRSCAAALRRKTKALFFAPRTRSESDSYAVRSHHFHYIDDFKTS
jgi:hypothetical protein